MTQAPKEGETLSGRVKSLDEQALAQVFSDNRDRLWRMVNFRLPDALRDRVDPDDVLQDAYLAAVQKLKHYDASAYSTPFNWLRAVVKQTLIDIHRHHLGAQMRDAGREVLLHASSYSEATSGSLAAHLVADITSPSSAAARQDLVNQVEQALEGMDPIDREVLALRHFEELSNSEVAQELRIEQKAASIRYVRALRRLRTILSQVPGFFDKDPLMSRRGQHDG